MKKFSLKDMLAQGKIENSSVLLQHRVQGKTAGGGKTLHLKTKARRGQVWGREERVWPPLTNAQTATAVWSRWGPRAAIPV